MRCLVTGGAGFIGSHVVEGLLRDGHSVRILDNFSTGNQTNLLSVMDQVELITGDIRSGVDVEKATAGIEWVFHLAAHISVAESMKDPSLCFDINVTGTNNLLQAAVGAGVSKVVISSSAAVYGDQVIQPITETAVPLPVSPYGASKLMDEILANLYTRSFNLPVVCLRYFNVYGPRQNPNSAYAAAIPIFISKLLRNEVISVYGDGGQTRDFLYVQDVVRANIAAANAAEANGKIINICGGIDISINDLINTLREAIPNTPAPVYQPPRSGDIYHSLGDPTLAVKLMQYSPVMDLKTGLKQTIDWMQL